MMMTFEFWPGYLEIGQRQGLDFVVVDLEHGGVELPRVEELCRTARLLDLPLLIRPQSCSADLIKRAIDIGGGGLMVPWMETQEQLDILHAAAFCPPRGRHGMGGPSLLSVPGVTSQDWARLEDNLFVMCQIETHRGLEFAPRVAAEEWVDALMVGPYDLAHNLGVVDQYLKAEVHLRAIDQVRDAAHAHRTWAGMVVGTGEQAREWFDRGFDLIILGAEITHFTQGLARNLAAARPAV
jgi:2-keto-3-deoxy-L-rhamnonate aldolase RhmA